MGRPVADQIIAETDGNPLALIEIGRELAAAARTESRSRP